MPKKGKKSGKKGKKGKKGRDNSPLKMAARNTTLWESRINTMDNSRKQYRQIVETLAVDNDQLRDQMRQTEKDTLDVVSFLKKQDVEKDLEIERLQQEIQNLQIDNQKDTDELLADFHKQRRQLDEKLFRKENELEIVRHELNQVKDFRKKKGQMQEELDEIKEAMLWNQREHKETLEKLEEKFSDEKHRAEQESNKKIEEIAEQAQNEALKTLDEKTRNIYKENVDLVESLRIYKQELENLKQTKDYLTKQLKTILNGKEINDNLVKEKIELVQNQNQLITELKEKIQSLETSLTQFIEEFDIERRKLLEQSTIEHQSSQNEIIKLQRALELKIKEMNKVKKLGKTILEQRSELELMFLDSLQTVKRQIIYTRLQYHKDSMNNYQNRLMSNEQSKIGTLADFEDEERLKWMNLSNEIDVSDLTWEQKEQVLRELFVRMNTRQSSMTDSTTQEGNPISTDENNPTNVFLTQTDPSSDIPKLPQII